MTDTQYSRDQLMQGLRSAHDAGDTDAATAFAKRLQQFDAGGGGPPTPTPAAGSVTPAPNQPSFTQNLLSTLGGAGQALGRGVNEDLRLFNKGLTLGGWDKLVGAVRGTDEAAKTTAAEQAGGYASMVPEALGYAAGPGKLFGAAGLTGIGGAAAEGSIASGTQAAIAGQNVPQAMATGGIASGALHPVASGISSALQKIGAVPTPSVPKPSDIQNNINNLWEYTNNARYSPNDVKAVARGAQSDAAKDFSPMTEITNPKAKGVLDDFSDYSADPTSMNSVRELRGWQDKATNLQGDDARFGANLSNRISDLLKTGTPTKVPGGMTPASVQNVAQNAHEQSALLDQYNAAIGEKPTTMVGKAADALGAHSWGIGHHIAVPAAEATLAGMEAYHLGGAIPAIASVAATLGAQPALNWGAKKTSDWAKSQAGNQAMQSVMQNYPSMGTPGIDPTNPLHRLLLGSYLGQPSDNQ